MPKEIDLLVLRGHRLVTAVIRYYLPDRPGILAPEFVWQQYDLCPQLPRLKRFLDFWQREIEGPLHSVTVANREVIAPAQLRTADAVIRLH